MKTIKKLIEIKKKKHLTYYELSVMLGFHSQTIARWIRTKKINPQYAKMLQGRLELCGYVHRKKK